MDETLAVYDRRQASKQANTDYREAAAKKYGIRIPFTAEVRPVEGGAFVEAFVWVSEAEMFAKVGKVNA